MTRKFSPADPDDLIRRYVAGASMNKLAGEFGVDIHAIDDFLTGRNIPVRRKTATKRLAADADAILTAYAAGENATSIAERYGVDVGTVLPFLRRNGVAIRSDRAICQSWDAAEVVRRYEGGESPESLAECLGASIPAVLTCLRRNGITLRGQSAAERMKWERLRKDRKAVERQCAAAWAATKGRKVPLEQQIKKAQTLCKRLLKIMPDEQNIADALRKAGYEVGQQTALKGYNLDITLDVPPIAIEVQKGHWSESTSMRPHRLKDILNSGRSLLIIYYAQSHRLDVARATQNVIAFIERCRRDPSTRGKYGVIGRDGQPVTPRGIDLNDLTRIEGF